MAQAVLIPAAAAWWYAVNSTVPSPYLDEVFHIRQAQEYCAGHFNIWDPKITTPPGLYLVSIALRPLLGCSVSALRLVNVLALLLLASCVQVIYSLRVPQKQQHGWLIQHHVLNIALFPPLFFFSGLYYTDILSTLFVLLFYIALLKTASPSASSVSRFAVLFTIGAASLMFRQTNIFWVAVFPACVILVDALGRGHPVVKDSMHSGVEGFGDTFYSVAKTSWKMDVVYDRAVGEASIEDFLKTIVSIGTCALKVFTQAEPGLKLPSSLSPFIALLLAFASFVLWNGSVVLGDKANHVASLHLTQMLYIWPYITFFSWPLVLWPLLQHFVATATGLTGFSYPTTVLGTPPQALRLPRMRAWALWTALAMAVVRYNTIVHPFTLADNRHYMFYVFRLLTRQRWVKYTAIPFYIFTGWVCVQALGVSIEGKAGQGATQKRTGSLRKLPSVPSDHASQVSSINTRSQSATTSIVLILIATSALQLVTAPLVEPRYFILPWIFWRMHLPVRQEDTRTRLWIESAWLLAVNAGTGYIFLRWGFEWPQEPGLVQRFMW